MNRTYLARPRVRSNRAWGALMAVTATAGLALAHSVPASASSGQVSIIQDGLAVSGNTPAALNQFRQLGATTVRYLVFWKDIAPSPNARKAPKFNAGSPGAYPKKNWTKLDAIISEARHQGLKVDLDVTGPAPNWAQGKGVPQYAINRRYSWNPNAKDYGSFVHALATRYSGKFKVGGKALPRVNFWALWNEPNFGQDLGPQNVKATTRSNGYAVASGYYRNLVRYGWSALQQTGHGKDTILIGEFAAEGRSGNKTAHNKQGLPGNYAQTYPLQFIRTLYCVDAKYHPLRGQAAKYAGCPTDRGGTKSFRKNNPGLFNASGASDHPYASLFKPTAKVPNSQYAVFPVINRFGKEFDKTTRTYGGRRQFPVYSTEFGYITSPPKARGQGYFSPATAAEYMNEAEFISYKNSRIRSYAQYLLSDPPKITGVGEFPSGLYFANGKPKPALNAYRLPLWMPHQTVKRNSKAEVWGGARPAFFANGATHAAQKVKIEQRSGKSWKTLTTVTAAKANGYFDARVKFSSGGQVRLSYTYPKSEPFLPTGVAGSTIVSRTINVKVK